MMKTLPLVAAISACLAFSNVMAHEESEDKYNTYHVTITNTTVHHVITPPTVIAHKRNFRLFKITKPASEELSIMAESGNNMPLIMSLRKNKNVYSVMSTHHQTPPVILPGQSIKVTIKAPKDAYFTVAGMLATTNDAFMSARMPAPKKGHANSRPGLTYDAGSEDNNELCIDIPGPPCGGTNATIEGDGEGYVTIHNGIHGVGDLMPAKMDWRGPTAMVRIHNGG